VGGNGAALGHIPQTGSLGSRNGSGGTASPDTPGSGTSEHTGSPTTDLGRRRLSSSAGAAHAIGSAPTRLVSGLFANRGEEARAWERLGVLLSSASCPYLERRLWSLLLRVVRAVSPLVGYPPLAERDKRSARIARLPLRPSGDVTHRANRCATPVAYSS